jgi:hypothetical protein
MAASNAHFWIGNDWDSSEEIMMRSRRFCIRVPRRSHVDLISGSMVKTLIIAFQGVQALYVLATIKQRNSQYDVDMYLGNVFYPIAILGLLRLPSALWMSDDADYMNQEMMLAPPVQAASAERETEKSTPDGQKLSAAARLAPAIRLPVEPQDGPSTIRFRPSNGPSGIAVRAFYLLSILALTGFTVYQAFPPPKSTPPHLIVRTVTNHSQLVFFLFFLLVTSCILCFYFLLGDSTTAIIPCFRSTWYRLYTAMLVLGALLLMILAAIETRQEWCGQWTTYPDDQSCPPK